MTPPESSSSKTESTGGASLPLPRVCGELAARAGIRPVGDVMAHPLYRTHFVPLCMLRPAAGVVAGDVLFSGRDLVRLLQVCEAQLAASKNRITELEDQLFDLELRIDSLEDLDPPRDW